MDLDAIVKRFGDRITALESKAGLVATPAGFPPPSSLEGRLKAIEANFQQLSARLGLLERAVGALKPATPGQPSAAPAKPV